MHTPPLLSDMDDITTASDAELLRMVRLAAVRAFLNPHLADRYERISSEIKKRAEAMLKENTLKGE